MAAMVFFDPWLFLFGGSRILVTTDIMNWGTLHLWQLFQGSWPPKSEDSWELKTPTCTGINALFMYSPNLGPFFFLGSNLNCAFQNAGVLRKFMEKRLLACLEVGDLPHYRLLLNKQTAFFRNLPVKPIEVGFRTGIWWDVFFSKKTYFVFLF